ncbi:hypothetical protein F2Q69_00034034 [Brassica cretica]|uniref:HD-Zip IV C-terminal domain-containing protein n=1 Tax=Brassica cretica TaxID=69181 RepID=A0A8S9SU23_BRACR|nr:hypothetical protein F2Q69_00034034 [Brassica cretica]
MNGQEDDYDDVYIYISSPSFMGIAEDDEINDIMGAASGAGDQDSGNTIRNIMPIPQQIQEPENIYQECPHPMGTQARVDDIQNAPVERNSVLQETWNDASGALLVYAPVDMEKILASENSDSVQILPSGFSILPDGGGETDPNRSRVGCLLTLGYQMLHSVKPGEDVDQDFVKKVELLMDRTMGKIKSA